MALSKIVWRKSTHSLQKTLPYVTLFFSKADSRKFVYFLISFKILLNTTKIVYYYNIFFTTPAKTKKVGTVFALYNIRKTERRVWSSMGETLYNKKHE
ncbi:hypothetical protein DXA34_10305 [[Clostridium] symbiosum]|nr:hypothetical protein DXA34_10305 [[Clostridium] symbiosum]